MNVRRLVQSLSTARIGPGEVDAGRCRENRRKQQEQKDIAESEATARDEANQAAAAQKRRDEAWLAATRKAKQEAWSWNKKHEDARKEREA